MILTGIEIKEELKAGNIVIRPFIKKNLGPNSYDVTLGKKLRVYNLDKISNLDMKINNPTREITIPDEGYVMQPDVLYLGCTNETATSLKYVPFFEGRSSIGRLGINTHITAGFGDIGWGYVKNRHGELECQFPTWTLEINVIHPIRIYSGIRIGQVYFLTPSGDVTYYQGKYSLQRSPQPSKLFKDF
jgi:dCTP deaminase